MNGASDAIGAAGPLLQLAPFALILVVFYFLLVRPQQKKARETQEMLDGLRVSDEVVTTGGLHGRIVRLADRVVTLEVAPKVQVRIDRTAVGQVVRGSKSSEGRSGADKTEERSA
jgi:preprotein translocase subunit YajC